MKSREIRKIIHYSLMVLTILMIITGLGITEPGIVGSLTFGILGKATAYRLHFVLWGPFVILLILHVYISLPKGRSPQK
jgi:thiosulfate reductase cytochrome b subunit